MNTPLKQPPDSETAAASSNVVILVHFGLPPIFSPALDIYRPGQFMLFARGLECTLRASGLLVEGTLCGGGALCEGLILFTTPHRNGAIAAVKDFLAACSLLFSAIEIAWQCTAEGILRTAWPLGPTQPFDRHLDATVVEQRIQLVQDGLAEADRET